MTDRKSAQVTNPAAQVTNPAAKQKKISIQEVVLVDDDEKIVLPPTINIITRKTEPLHQPTVDAIKLALLKSGMMGGRRSKGGYGSNSKGFNKKYRATLVYQVTDTSGSGSAQAPVNDLNPYAASEWSTWAALFDMARVMSIDVQASLQVPTTNTIPVEVGIAYDPFNAGAYGSAIATELSPNHLYFVIPGTTDAVLPISKGGFRKLHIKLTKQPIIFGSSSSGGYVGSSWFNTNISSSSVSIIGFLKSYVDAASAGSTVLTLNIMLNMEFQSRS